MEGSPLNGQGSNTAVVGRLRKAPAPQGSERERRTKAQMPLLGNPEKSRAHEDAFLVVDGGSPARWYLLRSPGAPVSMARGTAALD